MGQYPFAAAVAPSQLIRRHSFPIYRFLSASQAQLSETQAEDGGADLERIAGNVDYTAEIPDECLAYIFLFLDSRNRQRCSLVCRRWFRVDGESRQRLSLDARSEIISEIPTLFTRFDSVTKLALRCDHKSVSLNDDALILISIRCRNLTRLKLRGCRELTDAGMAAFAQNCKGLKKICCASCRFGAEALNAILHHCSTLEELSAKRLRGVCDGAAMIGPGACPSSLKAICLKEIMNGMCFEPVITGSKNLRTLKIIRCLGDWDNLLQRVGNENPCLTDIHLERLQLSDIGFSAISKCSNLESLHMVKNPECSNWGLISVAENCTLLRKLRIDGWRTNRIDDEGLISVSKHCTRLQELVLIGVNATHLGLTAIASNCQKLERLGLCGSDSIRDTELACIAAKCVALKKLYIKRCPISDVGIEPIAWGCPGLVNLKVKKCKGVTSEVKEWLLERRRSLAVDLDTGASIASAAEESAVEIPQAQVLDVGAPSSSNGILTLFRTKFYGLIEP